MALKDRGAAWLWLLFGALALGLLWVAVLARLSWVRTAGEIFLATPLAAGAFMFWSRWRRDPLSALVLLGLMLLFATALWM